MASAIPTRVGGRHPAHCTAVGKAILAASADDVLKPFQTDLLTRKTKYSISTTGQLRTELNKVRARRSLRPRRVAGGLRVRRGRDRRSRRSGRAVSVCGPMGRMMFDQRLVSPVRMAALGIWRQIQEGAGRVAPTLQQMRPLRMGPTVRGFDLAPEPTGLQFA